jgi:hypothetical protein
MYLDHEARQKRDIWDRKTQAKNYAMFEDSPPSHSTDDAVRSVVLFFRERHEHLITLAEIQSLDKSYIKHVNGPSYRAYHHMSFAFFSQAMEKLKFTVTKDGIRLNITYVKGREALIYTTASISFMILHDKIVDPKLKHKAKITIYDIEQPANVSRFRIPHIRYIKIHHNHIVYSSDAEHRQSFKIIKPRYYEKFELYASKLTPRLKKVEMSCKNQKHQVAIYGPLSGDPLYLPRNRNTVYLPRNRNNVYDETCNHQLLSIWNKSKYELNKISQLEHDIFEQISSERYRNCLSQYKTWFKTCIIVPYSTTPLKFNVNNFICSLPDLRQASLIEYVRNSGIYITYYTIKFEFLTTSKFFITMDGSETDILISWKNSTDNPVEDHSVEMETWHTKIIKIEVIHHFTITNISPPRINCNKITNRLIKMKIENETNSNPFYRTQFPVDACPYLNQIFHIEPNLKPLPFARAFNLSFHFNSQTSHKRSSNPQPLENQNKLSILSLTNINKNQIKIYHIDQINNHKDSLLLIQEFPSKIKSSSKIFSELIVYDNHFYQQTVGLLDSGADASLIHVSMLYRLFTNEFIKTNLQKDSNCLSSFTENSIKTLGKIDLEVKFHKYHSKQKFSFVVYTGKHPYNILLGQDIMAKFRLTLSFNSKHEPTLSMLKDKLKCFSIPPETLNTGHSKISLMPEQSKICYFKINPAFTCLSTEKILIEEQENDQLLIPASLSPKLDNGTVAVLLINKTNKNLSKSIQIDLSTISKKHKIYNKDNLPNAKNISVFRPIVQNTINRFIPNLTINQLNKTSKHSFTVDGHISQNNNIYNSGNKSTRYTINEDKTNHNSSDEDKTYPNNFLRSTNKDSKKINLSDVQDYMADNKYLPHGYEVPKIEEIATLINVPSYPKLVQPYVKRLFLEKYPDLWSCHAYEVGALSKTLGHCTLQLKKDVSLPPFKKLYFVQDEQRQHLADVLSFLVKNNIIEKANQHTQSEYNLWASPGYLVRKSNPHKSSYRLIIDYSFLNTQLISSPPVIPNITQLIEKLRGQYLYSTYDLSSAFYSVDLDRKSQLLTKFSTTEGNFVFKKLSMGLKNSPLYFTTLAHNMVHCAPVKDKQGNVIMKAKNMVELKEDKLNFVTVYFDDLIIFTPFNTTYIKTLDDHFNHTDTLMGRLQFHRAKLSPEKAVIAQTEIKFLGWKISNNTLLPDHKRIEKLLELPFPSNKTGIRAFCGLLQTLKTVIPGQYLEHMKTLSPLTSQTLDYKPEKVHYEAFNDLKEYLTNTPLFCKLINPLAKMYLFTDACTGNGSHYGAVLLQEIIPDDSFIPPELNVEDPIHMYIHSSKLAYEPLPLYLNETYIAKTKCEEDAFSPIPDLSYLYDEELGFGKNFGKSLFISLRSIFHHYKCNFFDTYELKKEAVKYVKKELLLFQLKADIFSGDMEKTKTFLKDFIEKDIQPDEKLYMVQAVATILKRKFILIFPSKIVYFNEGDIKPPIILGVYKTKLGIAFRPFRSSLSDSFNLEELKNRIEIVYFYSKMIPEADKNKEILSLESLGLLNSLTTLAPLVKIANLTAITDSKPLFLLFNKSVHNMHSKISRYCLRLKQEFPDLKLRFIKSQNNLSDFLSRGHKISKVDTKRMPLKYIDLLDDYENILQKNHSYTLSEWEQLVDNNGQFLTSNAPSGGDQSKRINRSEYSSDQSKTIIRSIDQSNTNTDNNQLIKNTGSINTITGHNKVHDHMSHLNQLLYDRSNMANIIIEQNLEFQDEIIRCKNSKDFEIPFDKDNTQKLINGVLFRVNKSSLKIILPETLISPIICLTHLSLNHIGLGKMLVSLDTYYIKNLDSLIRKFLSCCFHCFINNHGKGEKYGLTPLPTHVGGTIGLDLAEDVGQVGVYRHILIGTCLLSNLMIAWPLKSKTAAQVLPIVLFYLFQTFNTRQIIADGGPCFRHEQFVKTLKSLNIRRVNLASRSPFKNGFSEKAVCLIKANLKKYLADDPSKNWVARLAYIVRAFNTTKSPITGYSPLETLYGSTSANAYSSFINVQNKELAPPFQSNAELTAEIKKISEQVHKMKSEYQKAQITRKNKNRILHHFAVRDYVFIFNFEKTKGVSTPLRPKYSPDVYIVETVYKKSLVAKRLADNHTVLVSHNQAKKFNAKLVAQLNIPNEIAKLYLKKFEDLTKDDRRLIANNSQMTILDPPVNDLLSEVKMWEPDELEDEFHPLQDEPTKTVSFQEPEEEEDDPPPTEGRNLRSNHNNPTHVMLPY